MRDSDVLQKVHVLFQFLPICSSSNEHLVEMARFCLFLLFVWGGGSGRVVRIREVERFLS